MRNLTLSRVSSLKRICSCFMGKKKKKLQKAFWVEINQCLFFLIGFKMEHFDASLSTYFRAWLGPRGKVVLSLALPSFLPLLVLGNLWILHEDSLEIMRIFQWLDTRGLESWGHEQVQGPLTAGAETGAGTACWLQWRSHYVASLQPEHATDFTTVGGTGCSVLMSLQLNPIFKMHCCNRGLKPFLFYSSKGFLTSFCDVSHHWISICAWAHFLPSSSFIVL